ncbi:MAG TPA: hypothetical protein VE727_05180 [Solirubrobacterales bacterium]|nr:hypothetical protein [Solirubrobacterales bacterium]
MSGTSGRDAWLSLTPEPEQALPDAVATLRIGGRAAAEAAVRGERARVERLVVRARRRTWLAYLREVVDLIEGAGGSVDQEVRRARAVALEVVQNHHGLLLGVPGRAAEETAGDRSKLLAAAEKQHSNGGS